MSLLHITCLYPILFQKGSYLQHRFRRYETQEGFTKITTENSPPRYAHVVHGNSILYQMPMHGDETLLTKAWEKMEFPQGNNGHFDAAQSGCNLLYDARYGMFLMDFYLAIRLPEAHDDTDPAPYLALQSNLRKLLVADPRIDSKPCAWALQLQQRCLETVRAEMKGKMDTAHIEIPASMGYIISAFPESSTTLPASIRSQVIANFHSGDRLVERRPRMRKLPIAAHGGEVFLGWQSSTIWGVPREECHQLMPVFLTIQLVYSMYSTTFMAQTEELFEEIFYYDEERFRHLQSRTDRLLILMDKTIHDKNVFSSRLRPLQLSAFESLWKYWAMQEMINACDHSLNSSKRSLEMNINIIHEKMGERQNNLLFVLAIIQIVAMLGIINDYLALNDRFAFLSAIILGALIFITVVVFFFSYYERIVSKISSFFSKNSRR